MRNRALHDALGDFALEAAAFLTAEEQAGAELQFDVVEEPGSGPALYRYRPLTEEFIAERWQALRSLSTFTAAASALGTGAAGYLRATGANGAGGADAEPALQAMLERLYRDATGFRLPEERFESVYGEVERTLYQGTTTTTILARLHGLRLEVERVELGDGLALARESAVQSPRESAWQETLDTWPQAEEVDGDRAAEPVESSCLCLLERDIELEQTPPITEARLRFRRLLTGMRLFGAGGVAFGGLAWTRTGQGRWQPVSLGFTGAARGEPWTLAADDTGELRAFLEAVEDAAAVGAVSWALARFEMGCERALDTEALSDYLLALRALLDASDEADRASLPLRLAALCAEDGERRAVQRRFELALALERFVMGGGTGTAYVETIGSDSPRALAGELEHHLRALLRDVLCGYLDRDLKAVADEVLLESVEPPEPLQIEARDLRPGRAGGMSAPPRKKPTSACEPGGGGEASTPDRPEPADAAAGLESGVTPSQAGVTPSDEWSFDEDPASYSAPV